MAFDQLTFRLPAELKAWVQEQAHQERTSKTDLVVRAIEQYRQSLKQENNRG